MATAEATGGDEVEDAGPDTAREFAQDRLGDADSPLSPSEMAEEYGCSNPHMREVLRELIDEGVVERPEYGEYVLAEDEPDDSAPEVAAADAGNAGPTASDEAARPHAKDAPEPTGGEARSPATDGPESGPDEIEVETTTRGWDIGPGLALIGATVVFVIIVLAIASSSTDQEASGQQEAQDDGDVSLVEGAW